MSLDVSLLARIEGPNLMLRAPLKIALTLVLRYD